jgi:hypothetical protein
MPAVTFACPECGKVLRSAKPIPAGKKITCPTCTAVFPMPEPDDEDTAAVSEKPRRPAAAPARDDDDEDEEPRPRRRARDDDEDDDDRPRRKKARPKSKGRASSGGRLGLLIGIGVVLLLLLAGGGIASYFIWFHGINRGSGNEDPLAFIPSGSEVVVGVDYATILGDPSLGAQFEKSLREQGQSGDLFNNVKQETGLEFKELFAQTLVASNLDTLNNPAFMGGAGRGGPGGQPPAPPVGGPFGRGGPGGAAPARNAVTLIARSSRPFDQKKIVKSCKDAKHNKAHGKSYYEVNEGEFRTLFMPSNRTLVLSSLSATELDALFTSDGTTPSVSADTLALVRGVDKTTFWAAIPFEGKTRAQVDEFLQNPLMKGQPALDAIGRGKGAAIWGTLEADQVKIGANLVCADAAAAGQLAQGAEKAWNEQKGQLKGLMALLGLQMPKTVKVVGELMDSLKFTADGTLAKASAGTSRANLTAAIEEVQAQQGAQPGGGFGPGRGGPPNNPGRGGPPNNPPNPGRGRGKK